MEKVGGVASEGGCGCVCERGDIRMAGAFLPRFELFRAFNGKQSKSIFMEFYF